MPNGKSRQPVPGTTIFDGEQARVGIERVHKGG